jgi:hypothetical protein
MVWIDKARENKQAEAVANAADKHAEAMVAAIIAAAERTRADVKLTELQSYIESLNIQAATAAAEQLSERLQGIGTESGARSFYDEFTATVADGGASAVAVLPSALASQATFEVVNPYVSAWINNYRPQLIREITDTTREAIHQTIMDGLRDKKHSTAVARSVREIVGLTAQQASAVNNYRAQLEAQSNLQGMTPATQRLIGLRDQKTVARHLREGHLTQERIDAMVGRYRDNLIKLRANTIARTESFRAMNEGRQLAWEQFARDGLMEESKMRRYWVTARDDRVRPEHRAIPRMNPEGVGLKEPFRTPSGLVMNAPLDVACRCVVIMRLSS